MKRAAHASGLIIAALGAAFVGRELVQSWDEVVNAVRAASPWTLAAALLLAVFSMGWIGVMWRRCLTVFGVDRSLLDTLARYFVGQLGKYVPGGVWPVIGQAEMARRGGVPSGSAYGTTGFSLALTYLAAALTCLTAMVLGGAPRGAPVWWPVLLLLPIGLLGLHPAILRWGISTVERVIGRQLEIPVPGWSRSIGLLFLHVPVWLGVGFVTWLIAIDLDGGRPSVANILFAATLSWLVGFLAVGVPGGIGVREAVFIAAATTLSSSAVAAAIAVAARLTFIVADVAGAALTSLVLGRREIRDMLRLR